MTDTIRLEVSAAGFARHLDDDEHDLFISGKAWWGDADERAARGATVLDRVMPGWHEIVVITRLDMSLSCRCVLGQIFDAPAQQWNNAVPDKPSQRWPVLLDADGLSLDDPDGGVYSGFAIGLRLLQQAVSQAWPDAETGEDVDVFLGFDHEQSDDEDRDRVTYSDLATAWAEQIQRRRASA